MNAAETIAAAIETLESKSAETPRDWYEMIAILLRTVDPQLAILRDFQERYIGRMPADWAPIAPTGINALALARAVLGEES